ncbi:MAG: Calx-beta domain-containing protein [Piscinibacter sp.]|uniref:Calx-beta domain-containing protein n=1 Tax=Piscinibacter sp. TaxID=1903157 RepID=UPI003D0AAD5D
MWTTGFRRRARLAIASLGLLSLLAACGGGGGSPDAGPLVTRIGTTGGTATGPGGSQASVPAGALAQEVDIGIEASDDGAPPLPTDATRIGTVYAFTPHGTTFAKPVSVTVPFDPAQLPAGSSPALYKTTAGRAGWAEVTGAVVNGSTMVGSVTSFSNFVVVIPPLIKAEPRYEWEFSYDQGNGQGPFLVPNGSGEQVGGVLSELADLGQQPLDLILPLLGQSLPKDGRANGYVFAQGNGVTYGALAEAPFGALDTTDPIGGTSRLKQWQTFRKMSDDAKLTFTLTSVVLRLEDYLPPLKRRGEYLAAEAMLSVGAYLVEDRSDYFYYRGGRVTAWGERGDWGYRATNFSFSRGSLWDDSLFEQTVEPIAYPSATETCLGELVRVRFKQPRTYTIDLSSVPKDAEFIVRADVETAAINGKGGGSIGDCQGSHAYAYLRDPQEVGAPMIEYTGLLPLPTPSIESPPRDAYEPSASCPGGPLPAAGTLQFSTGFFAINEAAGSAPTILVTRTGGSTGAVSATFATLDGTGRAGIDYQPVLTTVHFGDGDSGTRVVEVPIIPNTLDEADRTVLLALSEPGGCASLGAPSSAVLTIEDDDPPAQTSFTVGGTVTGLAGSGLTIENLGRSQSITANGSFQLDAPLPSGSIYRIQVTAQPVNPRQACTLTNGEGTVAGANVTDVQIDCVTLPDSGSLDPAFGSGGRVFSTALGAPKVLDTKMARQTDG